MECRAYEKADYETIAYWFRERDLPVPPKGCLPDTGYIVDDVAAGFLYLTDSDVGILDCFIADEGDAHVRSLALDLITKHLIAHAKEVGVRVLKADTQNVRIADRASRHGFELLGQFTSFLMEL